MKNKFKLFILMILCSFLLVGCDQLSELLEINNISINEETISEMMNIEDFNLEDLEIIVEYQNGKTKKIPINSNMISEEDLLKFQKPGKHTIHVNYQGFEASFEIILHDGNLDIENAVVVVFMNHDETIYFTAAIDEDGRIKAPEVPSREGYKFIGWYVGENQFDFSQKVTESVIVYAKWTEKEYNVTVVDCFGNTLAETKCKYNHPFDVMPYVPENYNFEKCTVNGEEWISNSDLISINEL